jgi:regulator of sigma E protease
VETEGVILINTVLYILIAVIVFGVLIFVHELGHFLAAKACGIKVNEFSLGMGPKIISRSRGETTFSLRALPIGGFCAMEGEEDESNDSRSYSKKTRWQRAIVLVAGGFMNILVGFIIIYCITLSQSALASTKVAEFATNATSSKALQVGDKIININGSSMHTGNDIQFGLLESDNGKADITVIRDGKKLELKSVQFPMVSDGSGGKAMVMDFYVAPQPKTFFGTLYHAFFWTVSVVKLVWVTLIKLITGTYGLKMLSGPVGVTVAMGQAASMGISTLFYIVAMIAVNLGVVNLLPLPALDGGKLLFVVIEAIRRKPVNPKYEGWVHLSGFALLMLLLVVVTYNDIVRTFIK